MTNNNTTRGDPAADARARRLRSILVRTAFVAAVFSLAICAVMAVTSLQMTMDDPLDSPQLLSVKAAIEQRPRDEQLKQQFRRLDLQLRDEYFRRQRLLVIGSYLLAGGLAVFLLAAKLAADLSKKLPAPGALEGSRQERTARKAHWSGWRYCWARWC